MVDLNRVDGPVSGSESSWVGPHVPFTASLTGTTAATPHRSRPISTERSVEDNVLVREIAVDVASTSSIERHDRSSPVSSNRLTVLDISWDVSTLEEPDVDSGALPLHGVDSTTDIVEVVSVRIAGCSSDTAASVTVVCMAV